MRLSNRQSKIVNELLSNDKCITGQYLANVTGVTSRTIRGDIRDINEQYAQGKLLIQSISGKGYYVLSDKREYLGEILRKEQDYIIPILPDARVEHIIKQLIINPKGLCINTIAEQLYVSKSTLDRDINKVSQMLIKSDLSLAKKRNDIICIEGKEIEVRNVCIGFFIKVVKAHSLDKSIVNKDVIRMFNKVKEILMEALEEYDIILSGNEFDSALIFLIVVVLRNENGFDIENYDKELVQQNEFTNKIIEMLSLKTGLNEKELRYIRYNISKITRTNIEASENNDLKAVLNDCLVCIGDTFRYEFSDTLVSKLLSVIDSIHYIKPSGLSLHEIKREYPLAAEMAVSLVNSINHHLDMKLHDETLVKIVLAFAYEMEQDALIKKQKKRDIAIVCQSGELTNDLIKIKMKHYFDGFNILGFYPLYKLETALELKPEIIISTTMIDSDDIPVVVINPLVKDYDVIKINTVIRQIEHRESNSYEFNNMFKENLFIKDMIAFDKHDAIKQLFDVLKQNEYASDDFFQAVIERENISSTAIGNMVAVPHAIGNSMRENVVSIGILRNPINWNEEKVQIIFLINIQNATDGTVKQIFKSFLEVISSSEKVRRLIKSKNYYEFIKTINQ